MMMGIRRVRYASMIPSPARRSDLVRSGGSSRMPSTYRWQLGLLLFVTAIDAGITVANPLLLGASHRSRYIAASAWDSHCAVPAHGRTSAGGRRRGLPSGVVVGPHRARAHT